MRVGGQARLLSLIVVLTVALPTWAHEADDPPPAAQTVVRARRLDRPVGDVVIEAPTTNAATAGGGTASDLLRRAPGVFISQHSGQGKAHQIFLRGFDAEHGQDLEITVDGVPQNDVSHLHGQGYADVTLLPPELVQRFVLRPGFYDVRQGDFAVAGSLDFRTGVPAAGPLLRTTVGAFGLLRAFAAVSIDDDDDDSGDNGDHNHDGRTYAAVEAARGDGFGPRRAFSRASGHGQQVLTFLDDEELVLAASAGVGRFDAPGVLRDVDVDSGLFDRFGVYDDRQGGENMRAQASALLSMHEGGVDVDARVWTAYHRLALVSDFTGVLLDPAGDRARQENAALIGGVDVEARHALRVLDVPLRLALGTRSRVDSVEQRQTRLGIDDDTAHTVDVDAAMTIGHVGVYGEVGAVVLPGLVVRGGLRTEVLMAQVDRTPSDVADDVDTAHGYVLAPRLVVGWRALDLEQLSLQLTAAAGEGFRTPQGRSLGDLEVAQLTQVRGADVGAQLVVGDRVDVGVTGFVTYVQSDRVFDHAAARNLFLGPTLRTGVTARVVVVADAVVEGLTLGSAWTVVSARVLDELGSSTGVTATIGSTVPYAPPLVGRFEAAWRHVVGELLGDDVTVAAELDPWLVGPRPMPLSEVSPAIFMIDGAVSVGWRRLSLSVESTNLLDAVIADGAFVYASDFSAFGGTGSGLPARHLTSGTPRFLSASLSVGW